MPCHLQPMIFIVDDDAAVRDAVQLLCLANGLSAETYDSAQDFLDNYPPGQPGCLVLDLRMPGMSGLELQTELAARRNRLPIILITGHGSSQDTARVLEAGALVVLDKPFDPQVLLKEIRKGLAQVD